VKERHRIGRLIDRLAAGGRDPQRFSERRHVRRECGR
jgi:hypothetical protein